MLMPVALEPVRVPIKLDESAQLPEYASAGAAGMDVRTPQQISLQPGQRTHIATGLRVSVPDGFELQVRPRSGLALRHGLALVNSPGTIDPDFRGEIGILLINLGSDAVEIAAGERIAQLVLCPVAHCEWQIVDQLEDSERGEGGFGSTGTQ